MAANGVLNEVCTTSRARLGMRGSIKVRFPDFRSVTFTFSSSLLKVPNVELKDTNTKCQKEFILSIFDVTESDEGTYSCHFLCDYENAAKAEIDLKVVDDIQAGRNFLNSCFTIKSLPQ